MLPTIIKISALILVLYIGVSFIRFRRLVSIGVEMASRAIPFQRLIPNAQERILIAGDSTVVGTGSARPEDSTAGRLGADYPKAEIVNLGRNGKRAVELDLELHEKELGHFDIVIIQIGGNDISYGTPLGELEKSVRSIIMRARELGDKVVILHTGNLGGAPIFPRIIGAYLTHRTLKVRDLYIRLTDEYGVRYADIFENGTNDILGSNPDLYYSQDKYHPSGAGYGVWYEFIQKALKKRTAKAWKTS